MANAKAAVAALCTLLLIATVVTLVTFHKREMKKPDEGGETRVSASQKAITNLCSDTDYKHTCVTTLQSSGNTTDPKKLIQTAFAAAIKEINQAMQKSAVLDQVDKDARGKSALQSCRELAGRASADLERSFNKMQQFDLAHIDTFLSDLQIWLSGAITYQETCLDGFEGVQNDSGEKMRGFLKMSMEMTSNALALVTATSSLVSSLITGRNMNSRRLLSDAVADDRAPPWMASANRRLLALYDPKNMKPDLVVAKDGSGDYATVNEALGHVPKKNNKTFTVYIKEGVYEEKVHINSSMKHLIMVGDGPTKTKITGKLNFADGITTYHTATVAVQADHFTAVNMGFENSAGAEKHQAVALRVSGDMAVFYNCQMDGYQDTLYAHTYRQFYRDCVISGTIDFIFGDSAAVFQNCKLVVRKPMDHQQCIVTAQGRKDVRQPTGIVVQNCSFVADPAYFPVRTKLKSFLARPWKEYSRTVIMESFIDDLIAPEGWLPWDRDFALQTLMYTEFSNRGPGSSKDQRVKWEGVKELPMKRVKRFTADKFIAGKKWIPATKVPYDGGFTFEEAEDDPDVEYSPISPSEVKDKGKMANKSFILSPPTNSTTSDKDKGSDKEKEKDKDKKKEKEKENDHKDKKEKDNDKDKDKEEEKEKGKKKGSDGSSSPSPAANAPTPPATAPGPAAIKPSPIARAPTPAAIPPSHPAKAPSQSATATSPAAIPPGPVAKAPSLTAGAPGRAAIPPSLAARAPSPAAKAPEGVSKKAAAPSDAPGPSPVLQPRAGVSSMKKFLLTGW